MRKYDKHYCNIRPNHCTSHLISAVLRWHLYFSEKLHFVDYRARKIEEIQVKILCNSLLHVYKSSANKEGEKAMSGNYKSTVRVLECRNKKANKYKDY